MIRPDQRTENVAPNTLLSRFGRVCAFGLAVTLLAGCQSFRQSLAGPPPNEAGRQQLADTGDQNSVAQVSHETSVTETAQKNAKAVANLVRGREREDADRAKQLYKEADSLFRSAQEQPKANASKTFASAAKLFRKAGEASPGTALQQDALFMQAESEFFANRLTDAAESYQRLQKDFPRNRHNDRSAARLFSISRYWIDVAKATENSWIPINLTDAKRPTLDVDGHAIRVLDQIRYDDPTGRLADDATMAAAAEYIRQGKYERADEFLTDLREAFTDSDHLFMAHMLGIHCKLEVYAGSQYGGLVLEEADKLIKQTRQRFPDKLSNGEYAESIARAAAEVDFHRAERLANRAEYREKRKEYGAAAYYYRMLLTDHQATPQAEKARRRLQQIEKLPAVPTKPLAWLTKVFPDSRPKKPLETIESPSSQTKLR